jgi:hypothetical protein
MNDESEVKVEASMTDKIREFATIGGLIAGNCFFL